MQNRGTVQYRLSDGRLAIAERMAVGRKWHFMVTGVDFYDAGECRRDLSKKKALELLTNAMRDDILERG